MMVLPWRDQYMIGSTDLRFEGDLDRLGPTAQEVEYILRETNEVLPRARLTESTCCGATRGCARYPTARTGTWAT
jgi:glycerol-3-phosphate dehydrogenase